MPRFTRPIAGVVVDKKVNSGDTVSPGQALLDNVRPRANADGGHGARIAGDGTGGRSAGGRRLDSLGLDCHATISEIVPEAQAESRSFQVKVTGPCPPNVYSGMFGRIFIPLGEEEVLVVPPQAVRRVGQLDEVDVVENGTTRRHVVQLGRTLPEGREVLSGLQAGERVVLPRTSTQPRGTIMSHQESGHDHGKHDFLNGIVHQFLDTNFSIILIIVSFLIGLAALLVTPREEDPQIVVPMADVMVSAPGLSADQVEQLVATPLEKILYQIDGVEYVYSMARENQAIITVRFYVGQDRERSLVKLFKKLDENQDIVPPGVTGWVVKPVEIDDVPVVTLALTSATDDSHALRRVGEEVVERLAALPNVSRAYVVGGEPRTVRVDLDPERLQAYSVSPLEVQQALQGANIVLPAGSFTRNDAAGPRQGGDGHRPPGATFRAGCRRLPGPARFPQGCRHGPRRAGRSGQLRAPWLGTGTRI